MSATHRPLAAAALVAALLAAGVALAQDPDAGAPLADAGPADAGAAPIADAGEPADAGSVTATCVEHVPEGASRPKMVEVFPGRGMSGYAAELTLTITHGKGETVLPEGFRVTRESDASKELAKAGFALPETDAGSGPRLSQAPGEGGKVVTTLVIPLVTLPTKPGRQALVLPALPIAVARANNEFITVCTQPHPIVIDEPIANELDPKVKPNPPPRPQREEWVAGKQIAAGSLIGLVLLAAGALLSRWWSRRPKPVYVAPKRHPWLVALEELEEIRQSDLLKSNLNAEYFDRVSDCVRKYLGARYGFDLLEGAAGLETTSAEMRDLLKRVRPPVLELPAISEFLADCDLVKFARVLPSDEECVQLWERGEEIVRRTIPVMRSAAPAPAEAAS